MAASEARRVEEAGGLRLVPPLLEVNVPGSDVVVELGGEPWRVRSVRKEPPLAVLVRLPADSETAQSSESRRSTTRP